MPVNVQVDVTTADPGRTVLRRMGYLLEFEAGTNDATKALWFDHTYGTFWGASAHHGEDYGIGW